MSDSYRGFYCVIIKEVMSSHPVQYNSLVFELKIRFKVHTYRQTYYKQPADWIGWSEKES